VIEDTEATDRLKQSKVKPTATSRQRNIGNAIDVKGNMYTMMSLVLSVSELDQIEKDLKARVIQAPELFKNMPVIVDFSNIQIDATFDFNTLFKFIRKQTLLPVAVRGIEDQLRKKFQHAGVPIVEQASGTDSEKQAEQIHKIANGERLGTLIETPLQVGQQCVAENGDLILLVPTRADTELVADGNIHVYGPLHGRAICGVHGDETARIFCTSLQAQFVSVAGRYKVLEDIPASLKDCPVQIRLKDEKLFIEPV